MLGESRTRQAMSAPASTLASRSGGLLSNVSVLVAAPAIMSVAAACV